MEQGQCIDYYIKSTSPKTLAEFIFIISLLRNIDRFT